jgi:hypothetical protein
VFVVFGGHLVYGLMENGLEAEPVALSQLALVKRSQAPLKRKFNKLISHSN